MAYLKDATTFRSQLAADRLISSDAAQQLSSWVQGKASLPPMPGGAAAVSPAEAGVFKAQLSSHPADSPKITQRDRMVHAFTSLVTHAHGKGVLLTAADLVAGAVTACRANQLVPDVRGPARFLVSLANGWSSKGTPVDKTTLYDPARLVVAEASLWRNQIKILPQTARLPVDGPLI